MGKGYISYVHAVILRVFLCGFERLERVMRFSMHLCVIKGTYELFDAFMRF